MLNVNLRTFQRPELLETIRFIAVLRNGELIIPRGDTSFEIGDDVYVVGQPTEIPAFLDWVFPSRPHVEKVVIAGGSGVGIPLALAFETERIPVDLIEMDEDAANDIAGVLNRTTVIRGNALSAETLNDCSLGPNVAFVGATDSEENNIISCLLARKCGAGTTIAQVTDPAYVPIINSISSLERAVSTHLSMINAILHYIRGRQIESASILHMLPGELLEVNLTSRSGWAGKQISKLKMPKGAVIATVLRNGAICAPTGELVLLEGDRLVIFSTPSAVKKLSAIFQK
jgi:trk system potassium uptake protein TrkA